MWALKENLNYDAQRTRRGKDAGLKQGDHMCSGTRWRMPGVLGHGEWLYAGSIWENELGRDSLFSSKGQTCFSELLGTADGLRGGNDMS